MGCSILCFQSNLLWTVKTLLIAPSTWRWFPTKNEHRSDPDILTKQRWNMFKRYVHFCLCYQEHNYESTSEDLTLSEICYCSVQSQNCLSGMAIINSFVHTICAYSLGNVFDTVWIMETPMLSNSFLTEKNPCCIHINIL